MTPDEQFWFCGHICMSAKRLGFRIERQGRGPYNYRFRDSWDRPITEYVSAETEKETLKLACEKLVERLTHEL